MFSACKTFEFEAGHYLPGYDGACKNKHGHSYVLQVEVGGPILNDQGMVVDFKILKDVVQKLIVDKYDHAWLNDSFSIPTAENMVRKIVDVLNAKKKIWPLGVFLQRVRLYETRTSYIEWRRP